MQRETTHERPLESTSRESLPNGYREASLKIICRSAGVTTGALYFFFRNRSALFHALVENATEAAMQISYQHTGFEEEVYSNTGQLMDMGHDTHFAQELIFFYYAHEMAFGLPLNCSWGSVYQDSTGQIIIYLVKRNTRIIFAMVKGDDTVFNTCTLHWLSQIQAEAFLHTLSHHYSQEQILHRIRIVVTFLRGGFEGLHQQAVRN